MITGTSQVRAHCSLLGNLNPLDRTSRSSALWGCLQSPFFLKEGLHLRLPWSSLHRSLKDRAPAD
jgi:hypothetical protein